MHSLVAAVSLNNELAKQIHMLTLKINELKIAHGQTFIRVSRSWPHSRARSRVQNKNYCECRNVLDKRMRKSVQTFALSNLISS